MLKMIISSSGMFIGKNDDITEVGKEITLKEGCQVFLGTGPNGVSFLMVNMGIITVLPHNIQTVIEVDRKSPVYDNYTQTVSGLSIIKK